MWIHVSKSGHWNEIGVQTTGHSTICSTLRLGKQHRTHQSSALLALYWGIYCWSVDSPHKGPVTRKTISCHYMQYTWWRHQMETFSALLAICAGNSPASGEFPAQRPVTRSLDVFFDLRLNKRLRKQSRGWWFETLSCPLWGHRNELTHSGVLSGAPFTNMV